MRILHDEYSVYDARLVETRRMPGMFVWYMRGTCPHHGYEHQNNRWTIRQYDNNQDFCMFHCFHSNVTLRMPHLPIDWYIGPDSLHRSLNPE